MDARLGPTGLIQTITTTGAEGVRAGTEVLIAQIQSQTKLKFGLYALASVFVITSALLAVFAPENREVASSIVAGALFVVAVGCAGFGTFAFKTPLVSAQAGTEAAQAAAAKQARPVQPAPAAPRVPGPTQVRSGPPDTAHATLAGALPPDKARRPAKAALPLDAALADLGSAEHLATMALKAPPRAVPPTRETDKP